MPNSAACPTRVLGKDVSDNGNRRDAENCEIVMGDETVMQQIMHNTKLYNTAHLWQTQVKVQT